jgi:hypothetical protein
MLMEVSREDAVRSSRRLNDWIDGILTRAACEAITVKENHHDPTGQAQAGQTASRSTADEA